MNTAKRVLFLALLNVFLIALLVYGFELLLSPFNHLPINGRVGGQRYTWGHLVTNNKYGFRERDFKTPKPPGIYRVMVLGDSLTWGAGLDVRERYTAVAERLLSEAFSGRTFEILNFGIPGGPTTRERDVLQEFRGDVNPDLIVVGFCLNDPQPKSQDYSVEKEKLDHSIPGYALRAVSELLLYLGLPYTNRLLNAAFYETAERLGLIPNWQIALGRAYDPSSSEWRQFVQALKDIKMTSDALHLPPPIFAILNQGRSTNQAGSSNETYQLYSHWYRQAEAAATDVGFISYNHEFEIAQQLPNQPLGINALDGHPSASVNRIYGEKLYQQIAKQLAPRAME